MMDNKMSWACCTHGERSEMHAGFWSGSLGDDFSFHIAQKTFLLAFIQVECVEIHVMTHVTLKKSPWVGQLYMAILELGIAIHNCPAYSTVIILASIWR
jgi:hypothetical protein